MTAKIINLAVYRAAHPGSAVRVQVHFDPFDGLSPEYNWFIPRDTLVVRVLDRLFTRAPIARP